MTDATTESEAERLAREEHEAKLDLARATSAYYEDKRRELNLEGTERLGRYLEESGRFLHRGILYAHKDFDRILTAMAQGGQWSIVSGLNPSGALHLGHKAMLDVLLWFQKTYGARVYIPITNDESYVVGKVSSLRESLYNAYELVIPSILALGFDPERTRILVHSESRDLYNLAIHLSRSISYNTVRRLFGWSGSENPGQVFFMGALQVASIIMPQLPEFGGPQPVLVPVGIDQHPYISLARDLANRLDLVPPSEMIWKFLHGLKGPESKMSSSDPDSVIFLTDEPEDAARKIKRAYTGGLSSAAAHRALGGVPEVCSVFSLLTFNFLTNAEWDELYAGYKSGRVMSSEVKKLATERVVAFLEEHKRKREEARGRLEEFILDTPFRSVLELDAIPGLGAQDTSECR